MRHGRAKAARRTLRFFSLNGSIKPPYKVLLDGNFLAAVVQQKVPIYDRIAKTLQNEKYMLFVCRSALDELATLPGEIFAQARQYGSKECFVLERKDIPFYNVELEKEEKQTSNTTTEGKKQIRPHHRREDSKERSSSEASRDIYKLVSGMSHPLSKENNNAIENKDYVHNKQGYIVATQDAHLSTMLRTLANVPQMRLTCGVLIFDSPSSTSRRFATREERGKQRSGGGAITEVANEMTLAAKKQQQEEEEVKKKKDGSIASRTTGRKRQRAKGPNPLSCKKKKK